MVGTVALSQAAPLLAGGLNGADLAPEQLYAAQAILADGGPIAVAGARLGPQVGEIATHSLAHGYSVGLVVTSSAGVVAAVIAALFLRTREG